MRLAAMNALFLWLGLAPCRAHAENEQPVYLPGILITPTRHWGPQFQSTPTQRPIEITETELDSGQQRTMDEALRGRPGITLNKVAVGRESTLMLRGVVAGQNSITLDGVPLMVTIPGLNWLDSLPGEALGTASVTTGVNPAFYTASGLTGAIRLSSRKSHANDLGVNLEGGSFGSLRETVHGGLLGELGDIHLTASRNDLFEGTHDAIPQGGPYERDRSHASIGIARYGLGSDHTIKLDGSVLYRDSLWQTDVPVPGPQDIPMTIDDKHTWFRSHLWLSQNTLSAQLRHDWHSQLQLAFTANRADTEVMAHPMGFESQLMFADWRNRLELFGGENRADHLRLIWGTQVRHEHGVGTDATLTEASGNQRLLNSGFAELQSQWGQWYTELGMRLEGHERHGRHVLMHFGSRWQAFAPLTLTANVGNAFRPADYSEMLTPAGGNPQLRPERGLSADFGVEWSPVPALQWSARGFYGRYRDLLNMQLGSEGFPTYENIPQARIHGVETQLNYQWSELLSSGIEFTYQHTRNPDNGLELAMHPQTSGRLWLQWDARDLPWSTRLSLQYRSAFWNDGDSRFPTGSHLRLGLWTSYRISPRFDVYFRGENLTHDKTPDAWSHYNPGAGIYGGVHWQY